MLIPNWCPFKSIYFSHPSDHSGNFDCDNGYIYIVKPGDSLYYIARRFNISIEILLIANPGLQDQEYLYIDQKICIPIPIPEPPKCTKGFLYTVTQNDSLYFIANRFNLTTGDILEVNPQIKHPDILYVGQQICIPLPVPEPPACPNGYLYTVEKGETLASIALKFALTPQDILRANPQIVDPNVIFQGQKICIPLPIPKPPTCTPGAFLYTIQPGESLYQISNKFDKSLDQLIEANPQIDNPASIFPGQEICIPE